MDKKRSLIVPKPSPLDVISLLWKVPIAICRFLFLLSTRCFLPYNSLYRLHWRQKLPLTFLYTISTTLNAAQVAWLQSNRQSTGSQVRQYCASNNLKHEEVVLKFPTAELSASCLHFVVVPGADANGRTLFYAHGGGYQYAMRAAGCMPLALHLARSFKAARIVFLEYSLTPATQYPGQLMQVVEGLRYLLTHGSSASDLVIAGDSAGGHLMAGLLLHLRHPAPKLTPLSLQGKQLHAAVLLSPWLTMKVDDDSAVTNEAFDFLHCRHVDQFTELFNPDLNHVWANPIHASNAKLMWADVVGEAQPTKSPVVRRLLITAGDAEVLYDSCKLFMKDYIRGHIVLMDSCSTDEIRQIQESPAVLAVGLREVHVQPALDASQQYYDGGSMTALTCFLQAH